MATKIGKCVKCGGRSFASGATRHTVKVGNLVFVDHVPVQRCRSCRTGYFDGPALEEVNQKVAVALAARGTSNGEALRFMRKVLRLPAAELAELLSLAAETISRIETGKMPADVRTVALLGAMVLDQRVGKQATRRRLESLRTVERLRNARVGGYREQIAKLPPGPERDRLSKALHDWLSMGPKRKENLAKLYAASLEAADQ